MDSVFYHLGNCGAIKTKLMAENHPSVFYHLGNCGAIKTGSSMKSLLFYFII